MTIERIAYNEMRCDAPGCGRVRRVWEACNWGGWVVRQEGKDWDGETGGWHEAHYCPDHASPATVRA